MSDRDTIAAALQRSIAVRRSWVERKAKESDHTYCVCADPTPTDEAHSEGIGFHQTGTNWLRIFGTVQCAVCGRAIFARDGSPVRA